MTDLYKWSLERIRKDPLVISWLEDRRDEWTPLIASRIKYILEGASVILICDDDRKWFEDYMLHRINRAGNERPLLPFFSLRSLFSNIYSLNTKESVELLNDMLDLSFPNGYMFFYVGSGASPLSQIAKGSEDSYMWLVGEHSENGFYLDPSDKDLDIKLIQLFRLFDDSISAALFDEVVL